MAIDFEQVLAQKRKVVWQEIQKYLDDLIRYPKYCRVRPKYRLLVNFHQKIVAAYPERKGKYLRPSLVLLTAAAMGVPEKRAIKTAAAMQISEDWILNHDDIEDDSLQRRGLPALHRLFGKELAINAGDSLHGVMWKVLIDNLDVLGFKIGQKIQEEFYQMLNRTVLGQTVEIKWTQENKTGLSDEDILFILESKTGYYTIGGPMRLGAIISGATEEQLSAIYDFGRYLGQCFQIVDDLLDLTSDFKGLKKQIGNDIYEGKRTIMLMHLFRTSRSQDRKKLLQIMVKNRDGKTPTEVKWVIETMKKYGSLKHGQNLAEKLAEEAREIFEKKLGFLSHQPARDQLKAGINFILKREY